mmetsp:Transcript_37419/g.78925  ORF Transcript_37419/g.78925 Transcript_37419/m.78925 type:complete len:214 (+) Transcript_37419:422-1063(+)
MVFQKLLLSLVDLDSLYSCSFPFIEVVLSLSEFSNHAISSRPRDSTARKRDDMSISLGMSIFALSSKLFATDLVMEDRWSAASWSMKPIPSQESVLPFNSPSSPTLLVLMPTPREEDLTLANRIPSGVSSINDTNNRRWASSRISILCVICFFPRVEEVPFRFFFRLFGTTLRIGNDDEVPILLNAFLSIPLPQKKSRAYSESERMSTRFRRG